MSGRIVPWRSRALCLAFLLAAAMAPGESRGQQPGGATVGGFVYRRSELGRVPASGIAVRLVSVRRGSSATIYTDSRGGYLFQDVPAGEYYVVMEVSDRTILRTNLLRFAGRGTFRVGDVEIPREVPRRAAPLRRP